MGWKKTLFARNLPTVSVAFVGLDNKEETIEGKGNRTQRSRLPLHSNMRARNCLPLTTAGNSFGIVINFRPIKKKAGKKFNTFSIFDCFFSFVEWTIVHTTDKCTYYRGQKDFFISLVFILMHNPTYFILNLPRVYSNRRTSHITIVCTRVAYTYIYKYMLPLFPVQTLIFLQ